MISISIILVTYNSGEYIEGSLESIFKQGFKDYEVIVVDNGSEDDTRLIIKNKYHSLQLIENTDNYGPSKARNQGIAISSGEFILCLDSDVILEKDFLLNIYNSLRYRDEIGAVQPKVLKMDKKFIYTTGIYLSKARRFFDIGRGQIDNGRFSRERDIFGPSSAAALYRRKMLDDISVGGEYFDEDFFFLVEDIDVAWRAKRLGWKSIFWPEAVCYHSGNSSRSDRFFRQYLSFRNRYLLMFKNDCIEDIFRIAFFIFPYDILRASYFFLTNRYGFRAVLETQKLSQKMRRKRFLAELKAAENRKSCCPI